MMRAGNKGNSPEDLTPLLEFICGITRLLRAAAPRDLDIRGIGYALSPVGGAVPIRLMLQPHRERES